MNRKVCVVTGTRADYGLLRWIMQGIRETRGLELQIIATGMHLSPKFGYTYREIEQDGFHIDRKVDILLSSDDGVGLAKAMGLCLIGFGDALQQLVPDLLLVLGDRFEIFSAAAAAMVARVPIAHLHGGETSQGVFDESIRHSITKMSHLHFVASEEYRRRVIQLGEQPERVFKVGGLGIDSIRKLKLLDRSSLEEELGIKFAARNLLVTFHAVTLEKSTAVDQMNEVLAALETLEDTLIIFTMPNADSSSYELFSLIDNFVARHKNACSFISLGQLRYLSCLKEMDAVVGNSSSGLIEAPSLGIGTINIGDRQRGRLKASSVIECEPDRTSIASALDELYSLNFQKMLKNVKNPYGNGGASKKVVERLLAFPIEDVLKKKFFDLPRDRN